MSKKDNLTATAFVCVPCGKEVVVSSWSVSRRALWCCGVEMVKKDTEAIRLPKKEK